MEKPPAMLSCTITLEPLCLCRLFSIQLHPCTHSPLITMAKSRESALNHLSSHRSSSSSFSPPPACVHDVNHNPSLDQSVTLFFFPSPLHRSFPSLTSIVLISPGCINHDSVPSPPLPPPFLSPPLGSLDADHPHVLRVVCQLAVEALVLENRSNVVPVVFCYTASDGKVVCITWSRRREGN